LRKGRIEHELAPVGFEVFGGAMPASRATHTTGSPSRAADRRLSVVKPEPRERGTGRRSHGPAAAAVGAKREREAAAADAKRKRAELEATIEQLRQDVHVATTKVAEANEQLRRSSVALREARFAEKAARDALDAALQRARRRDV